MIGGSRGGMMKYMMDGGRGGFNGMLGIGALGNMGAIGMGNMMNMGAGINMNGGARGRGGTPDAKALGVANMPLCTADRKVSRS